MWPVSVLCVWLISYDGLCILALGLLMVCFIWEFIIVLFWEDWYILVCFYSIVCFY